MSNLYIGLGGTGSMVQSSRMFFEWLFMSGMKFRTHRSRRKYEELRKTTFDKKDLLINYTFEESLTFFEIKDNRL